MLAAGFKLLPVLVAGYKLCLLCWLQVTNCSLYWLQVSPATSLRWASSAWHPGRCVTDINVIRPGGCVTVINVIRPGRCVTDINVIHLGRCTTDINVIHPGMRATYINVIHPDRCTTDINIIKRKHFFLNAGEDVEGSPFYRLSGQWFACTWQLWMYCVEIERATVCLYVTVSDLLCCNHCFRLTVL